jgi:hypothetical protein
MQLTGQHAARVPRQRLLIVVTVSWSLPWWPVGWSG